MKFKPGDRIVCTHSDMDHVLKNGRVYTVAPPTDYDREFEDDDLVRLEELPGGWFVERFELALEGS